MSTFEEIMQRIDALTKLQASDVAELRRKIDELAQQYARPQDQPLPRPVDVAIESAKRAAARWVAMMETPDDMLKAQIGLSGSSGWFPASQAVIEVHGDEVLLTQQAWKAEAMRLIEARLHE